MSALELLFAVLLPMCAPETSIAESPLPGAEKSVNDGLKIRFAARFKSGIASATEPDDSIAVAAEWLQLKQLVGERQFGNDSNQFLGFISGRCHVAPPKWWGAELMKGSVTGDRTSWFPCYRIERRWRGDGPWRFSGFDAVEASGNKLTLKSGLSQLVLTKTRDFADVGTDKETWNPVDEQQSQERWIETFVPLCLIARRTSVARVISTA